MIQYVCLYCRFTLSCRWHKLGRSYAFLRSQVVIKGICELNHAATYCLQQEIAITIPLWVTLNLLAYIGLCCVPCRVIISEMLLVSRICDTLRDFWFCFCESKVAGIFTCWVCYSRVPCVHRINTFTCWVCYIKVLCVQNKYFQWGGVGFR